MGKEGTHKDGELHNKIEKFLKDIKVEEKEKKVKIFLIKCPYCNEYLKPMRGEKQARTNLRIHILHTHLDEFSKNLK